MKSLLPAMLLQHDSTLPPGDEECEVIVPGKLWAAWLRESRLETGETAPERRKAEAKKARRSRR